MTLRRPHLRPRRHDARPYPGDSGLSLIEMVVALGVVTVLLLTAGGALISLTTAQRHAEANDRAVHLANDRLEKIRRLTWAAVGSNGPGSLELDPDYQATVPVAKAEDGTDIVEDAVNVRGAAPDLMKISQADEVGANKFTVTTRVTWAGRPPLYADGNPAYANKRVMVTVSWKDSGKDLSVTAQTLRTPTLSEQIPTIIGEGSSDGCTRPAESPFCHLYVTTGKVMTNNNAGTVVTVDTTTNGVVPIQMRAVTRAPVGEVTAKVGGQEFPLVGSDDAKTWTLPSVGADNAFPIGPVSVVFTTDGGTDTYTSGSWQTTAPEAAEIRPVHGTTWVGPSPGNMRADTTRVANDAAAPKGTTEPTTQEFCVDPSGRLHFYQALLFDAANIDDQDAPPSTKPSVTYTGAPDPDSGSTGTVTSPLPATSVGHPSADSGTYDHTTGYVGAASSQRGILNTQRWYAAFPKGTVFRAGQSGGNPGQTTVTISMVRPADQVAVQAAVTLPVVQRTDPADCGLNVPPKPTAPTVTATGTTVSVSWSAVTGASSYRLFRAVQNSSSDPLTFTEAYTGPALTYSYVAEAGQKVTFYLVAANANGESLPSANAYAVTVPKPTGTVTAVFAREGTNLTSTVTLSASSEWTVSANVKESVDGGPQYTFGSANKAGNAWIKKYTYTLKTTPNLGHNYVYSVEVCNAAGCSPLKSSANVRMPYWFGVQLAAPALIITGDEVAGVTGDTRFGSALSYGQPGSYRSDKSILFGASGNGAMQDQPITPPPGTNGARSVEFSYKESGGFAAGWVWAQQGTTTANGWSAKNTASGILTILGTQFTGLKLNDGQWHHYVVIYNGGKITLIEDGVTRFNAVAVAEAMNTPATSLFTVGYAFGQSPTLGVSAFIDHFARYDYAMSESTAKEHYAGRADE